ncbi:hypothetical protein TWF730_008686 [Orbilia blumenaviensis]|uniref:Apple domain-containing protein n=1 Tax=Orbilia blumenaviensis TaxID=1796055 RepID=A0AAV9V3E3_9PEZI
MLVKSKVKRPTCTVVPAPATVTKKVTPAAVTKTLTVTQTVSTATIVTLPTVTVTKTHEIVETQTAVVTATVPTTEVSIVSTFVSTVTTFPFQDVQLVCTTFTFERKRDAMPTAEVEIGNLAKRTALPKCCGCFLTSTKTAARQTKTVTTTLAKSTVTKRVTKTVTKTSTSTALPSSLTTFKTTTEIVTATRTDTETLTESATETVSATQTEAYDECLDPYIYIGRNAFVYDFTVAVNLPITVNTLQACCAACREAVNCANYVFDIDTDRCLLYQVTQDLEAHSRRRCTYGKYCTIGRSFGNFVEQQRPDNELYGIGPCGGMITR